MGVGYHHYGAGASAFDEIDLMPHQRKLSRLQAVLAMKRLAWSVDVFLIDCIRRPLLRYL